MPLDEYRKVNLANLDSRVAIHYSSDEYGVERYAADPEHLSSVVRFDKDKVGPVDGKSLLHLQCHVGTDTVSWARLGADVTGVDFSPEAVAAGRRLSRDSDTPVTFVESELYDAPVELRKQFDVVYTGVGAICWLPDIRGWAEVLDALLKPGGTFYMREGHPLMWSLDWDDPAGTLTLAYPYFEGRPAEFGATESYIGHGEVTSPKTYDWNHGVGEVLSALLDVGLRLDAIEEYDFCEWKATEQMVEDIKGHWRLPEGSLRIPMMWSIKATKPL